MDQAPNHHADHPGFSGLGGFLAALTMVVGRNGDARVAAQLTRPQPGDHVVDVGCGPGAAVRFAARRGATVTGVDPAPVMLALARRLTRSTDGITYLEGVAEGLPLADGSANVVWSIATVHHWPDLEGGLAEARRVLSSGGRLVAIERHRRADAKGLASHGWTIEQGDEFAARCRAAGFVDVRVERPAASRRRSLVAVVAANP